MRAVKQPDQTPDPAVMSISDVRKLTSIRCYGRDGDRCWAALLVYPDDQLPLLAAQNVGWQCTVSVTGRGHQRQDWYCPAHAHAQAPDGVTQPA